MCKPLHYDVETLRDLGRGDRIGPLAGRDKYRSPCWSYLMFGGQGRGEVGPLFLMSAGLSGSPAEPLA